MCGIVGILGPRFDVAKYRLFQELMTVATVRGADGAGILAVSVKPKKGNEILRDGTITAAELAFSYDMYGIIKNMEACCLLGHARLPTSGGLETENCHPHDCGNIIGVHNGTMDFIRDYKVNKNDTDSLLLFDAINKYGVEDTIKKSLGAYAMVFVDKAKDTISFLRNKDRPLWFAQYKDEPKYLYWASEVAMLQFILHRHRPQQAVNYFNLPVDTLVSFRLRSTEDIKPLDKKDLSRPAVVSNTSAPKTGTEITQMYATRSPFVLDGHDLTKVLATGCAYCSDPQTFEDYTSKKITFFSRDEFICHECLAMDETARAYLQHTGVEVPSSIIPAPRLH